MLQDQIKVFSQRVEEFGDNQTLSSEWNSFVRFATIAGVRRQPRELKEELLKMLPKVGQGHTCTYCGYVTAIPSSYKGM